MREETGRVFEKTFEKTFLEDQKVWTGACRGLRRGEPDPALPRPRPGARLWVSPEAS